LGGLAALTSALAAAYSDYVLAATLCSLTILFLLFFIQIKIVPTKQ
jgi:hypothetical protein